MSGLEKQKVESKFYDIDDIIAKSESTSCSFEIGELNPDFFQEMLGITKPTQTGDGYGADAPLWLLDAMKTPFTIHLPQAYSVNMQGIMMADARNINLNRLQQHFYVDGIYLCRLMKEENPEGALNLARCILTTLTQRLGGIVSNSARQRANIDRFDALEANVFALSRRCKDDIDRWLRQEKQNRKRPSTK
uniref:DNA replication complex GINS protein PSF3 n=1 Tax=Caenorhabditis tropicalis TaxID=1561998 RepID=A0A1I7UEW5_9PELO